MSDPIVRKADFVRVAKAHALSRAAEGTRALYVFDLERWVNWCDDNGHYVTRPKLEHATAFRNELQANFAPLTVRRILASLSSMYGAALNQETPLATWNPFSPKALPWPPATEYTQTEAIADSDAEAIIDAAADVPRDHAILWLLRETGLRRASIAALRRNRLVKRDGGLVAKVTVKGNKEREAAIPPSAAAALNRWLAIVTGVYVFPDRRWRGEKPIHPSAINKVLDKYARIAKVSGVHPHQFRVAFITTALDRGVPLRDVQEAAHHASADTTQRYDRGKRGLGVADAVAAFRQERKR